MLLLDPQLGPLVTMVLQMKSDMQTFAVLCLVFVFGFGTGIVPLGYGRAATSASASASAAGSGDGSDGGGGGGGGGDSRGALEAALAQTGLGLLGLQDMGSLSHAGGWEAEVFFLFYLLAAQVMPMPHPPRLPPASPLPSKRRRQKICLPLC